MLAIAKIQEEIDNMLAYEETPDLSVDEQAAITAYVNELMAEQAGKTDSLCQWMKLASADADALEAEGRRLIARAKAARNRVDYIKQAAARFMGSNGIQKIKGKLYNLSLRKSEAVDVYDPQELPREFVRTKVVQEPDKTLIKSSIKAGENVPGARIESREYVVVR